MIVYYVNLYAYDLMLYLIILTKTAYFVKMIGCYVHLYAYDLT